MNILKGHGRAVVSALALGLALAGCQPPMAVTVGRNPVAYTPSPGVPGAPPAPGGAVAPRPASVTPAPPPPGTPYQPKPLTVPAFTAPLYGGAASPGG